MISAPYVDLVVDRTTGTCTIVVDAHTPVCTFDIASNNFHDHETVVDDPSSWTGNVHEWWMEPCSTLHELSTWLQALGSMFLGFYKNPSSSKLLFSKAKRYVLSIPVNAVLHTMHAKQTFVPNFPFCPFFHIHGMSSFTSWIVEL
jgi:hypothetical protein